MKLRDPIPDGYCACVMCYVHVLILILSQLHNSNQPQILESPALTLHLRILKEQHYWNCN